MTDAPFLLDEQIEQVVQSFASPLSQESIAAFQMLVLKHDVLFRRSFPWRDTYDPYAIFVSEVMLQQTTVERVTLLYPPFLQKFPTVSALSQASTEEVLRAWQGLGYNRRGLALKKAAEAIMADYCGEIPGAVDELQSLPGIGPYTSRAVAAFAFNLPVAFIETNIRSVYIHLFGRHQDVLHDRELLPLVEASMLRSNPRLWFQALMDLGAVIKKRYGNPSRRSVHHTRQSPFRGSNREVRSAILRLVLARNGISVQEILSGAGAPEDKVLANLEKLEQEGFLVVNGGQVTAAA